MKEETKVTLRNYAICFGIEALIVFLVIWLKGFFTESTAVNLQILSDAFFVAGLVLTLFAGMNYVTGEGVLVGLQYVLRHAVLTFIPMGRTKYERYADYRERKLSETKKHNESCILVTGLVFLFIGIILTGIWYLKFYTV